MRLNSSLVWISITLFIMSLLTKFTTGQSNGTNCQCGWRKIPRIVGGIETGVNEYSPMAGLLDLVQRQLYCGATIISAQHVITAAHCISDINVSKIVLVVGEHDVTTGSDTTFTKVYPIERCITHYMYLEDVNDVAICKIIGTIQFSANVGPVCLPFQHKDDSFGGATVTMLGWGLTEFGGPKSSVLRKADVKVIGENECRRYYPYVDRSNLCTFAFRKGSCQDSGGPIFWQNPTTSRLVLVGIISAGIGCGSDLPEVGTRTGHYIDWIVSVTPGVQYCRVE